MAENNDNKNNLTGKLQLKKTINAGQIKQSFSHGRSRSVSVEVKKKRSLTGFSKDEKIEQPKSFDRSLSEPDSSKKKIISEALDNKITTEVQNEKIEKKSPKKTTTKNFNEAKTNNEPKSETIEKPKQPKFVKSPKSFENRRQGKLTISQA